MKKMSVFFIVLSACNNNKPLSHEEIIDSIAKKQREHIDSVVARPPEADSLIKVLTFQLIEGDSIHVSGRTKDDEYYYSRSRPVLKHRLDSLKKLRLYPNVK